MKEYVRHHSASWK